MSTVVRSTRGAAIRPALRSKRALPPGTGETRFGLRQRVGRENAVVRLLRPGDHAVIPNDAYGGTYRLFDKVWAPAGLGYTRADLTTLDRIREVWRDRTRMVWIETPSNPLLSIVDIEAVAAFAHDRGALVVVDNTFATPYLQQPLQWGADMVVTRRRSTWGGTATSSGASWQRTMTNWPTKSGSFKTRRGRSGSDGLLSGAQGNQDLGPADGSSLRQHRRRGRAPLRASRRQSVLYPGLPDHPGHQVARRQMSGYGGMVSFVLAGGEQEPSRLPARPHFSRWPNPSGRWSR